MEKIVELKNIVAGYDDEVILKNVNLTVLQNDFIGVIGPNGGGKTTLVKVIIGLLKPVSGEIVYNPQGNVGNSGKLIGYLPQINKTDRKFPITVIDVVLSGLADGKNILKKTDKADKEKAFEILTRSGIAHLAKKNIGDLSGGQLQRVFLCRAIIADPKLLILDEPNTYVDNQFESDLYKTLQELNQKMAIMIISHDVGTITYFVKTIACVNRGLHYHASNVISQEQLAAYNCPIQIIAHGDIPHTILKQHKH
jgi:zinc transport system ATP-binding protein